MIKEVKKKQLSTSIIMIIETYIIKYQDDKEKEAFWYHPRN